MIQEIPRVGYYIDSGKPGKTVGILSLTHGNEPAGLQAQEARLNQGYADKVVAGKVYLIQVNPEAYRLGQRFVDINMNRVVGKGGAEETYEYQRLEELRPYLEHMDIVLDIHSTSKNTNNLMGICHTKDGEIAQQILETDRILIDDDFDNQGSVISIITGSGGVGLGIECGYHEQEDAYENALTNIHRVLTYAGCYGICSLDVDVSHKPVYRFYEEVFPVTTGFLYAHDYQNFDCIKPGEIYATDGDSVYKNATSNDLYIGIIGDTVRVGDGICFLFERQ